MLKNLSLGLEICSNKFYVILKKRKSKKTFIVSFNLLKLMISFLDI